MTAIPAPIDQARRPSALWTALAVAFAVGALGAVVVALVLNASAQRPIGEGELFSEEAQLASGSLQRGSATLDDLRRIRNRLAIESVGLVDGGVVAASTSENRIGAPVGSALVAGFAERGTFGAAAVTLHAAIELDGVVEFAPGDVVYQVVQPLTDGRSLLLTYDISELLARRSAARAVSTRAIELLALAAFLTVAAVGLFVARSRALRTYREIRLESSFLKREAEALAAHNRELDEAWRRAERAYELAEEKNRIRSEFVLMINHELRTPLTGVVTGAELLAASDAIEDPTWKDVIEDMVFNGNRLREMIDQILAVARIENRALFFELANVPLTDVLSRLSTISNTVVSSPAGSGDDVSVRTDPSSLVNLIASLAANALTHGASTTTISVTTQLDFEPMLETGHRPHDPTYFLIEDDGPGIDSEFLPRIFEKFEKRSWSSGTGLGLYIAAMVIEALEGSISVTTSPEGTVFALAIPVATPVEVTP